MRECRHYPRSLQCGARKGMSTDFAMHTAELMAKVCRDKNISSARNHVDIKSAYYSTVRQLLARGDTSSTEIMDENKCRKQRR